MKQRVVVQFYSLIAFACRFLKGWHIDQIDVATAVADHPSLLQSASNDGEARAPNAEHLRDVLLGERQFIAAVKIGRS